MSTKGRTRKKANEIQTRLLNVFYIEFIRRFAYLIIIIIILILYLLFLIRLNCSYRHWPSKFRYPETKLETESGNEIQNRERNFQTTDWIKEATR